MDTTNASAPPAAGGVVERRNARVDWVRVIRAQFKSIGYRLLRVTRLKYYSVVYGVMAHVSDKTGLNFYLPLKHETSGYIILGNVKENLNFFHQIYQEWKRLVKSEVLKARQCKSPVEVEKVMDFVQLSLLNPLAPKYLGGKVWYNIYTINHPIEERRYGPTCYRVPLPRGIKSSQYRISMRDLQILQAKCVAGYCELYLTDRYLCGYLRSYKDSQIVMPDPMYRAVLLKASVAQYMLVPSGRHDQYEVVLPLSVFYDPAALQKELDQYADSFPQMSRHAVFHPALKMFCAPYWGKPTFPSSEILKKSLPLNKVFVKRK